MKKKEGYFRDGALFKSKQDWLTIRRMAEKIQKTPEWTNKDEIRRKVGNIADDRKRSEEKNLWIAEQRRRNTAIKQTKKEWREQVNSKKFIQNKV